MRLVRVHRQQREPRVVGLGHSASQRMSVDIADFEILVEPPPPARLDHLSSDWSKAYHCRYLILMIPATNLKSRIFCGQCQLGHKRCRSQGCENAVRRG